MGTWSDRFRGEYSQLRKTRNVENTKTTYKQRTVLRSFFAVITEKMRETKGRRNGETDGVTEGRRRKGESQSWRKVAELISGTSGSGSFPRIMRGPRGVGFQENADCLPRFSFSLRTNSPSAYLCPLTLALSTHAINLRLRQSRGCISAPRARPSPVCMKCV